MNVLYKSETNANHLENRYNEFEKMFLTLRLGDIVTFNTRNGLINYLVVSKDKTRHLMRLDEHKVNRGNIDNPDYFRSAFRNRIISKNIVSMNIHRNGSFDIVIK